MRVCAGRHAGTRGVTLTNVLSAWEELSSSPTACTGFLGQGRGRQELVYLEEMQWLLLCSVSQHHMLTNLTITKTAFAF